MNSIVQSARRKHGSTPRNTVQPKTLLKTTTRKASSAPRSATADATNTKITAQLTTCLNKLFRFSDVLETAFSGRTYPETNAERVRREPVTCQQVDGSDIEVSSEHR